MVGSPSVPPEEWVRIAQSAQLHFFRFSLAGKASFAKQILELCKSEDIRVAHAAFRALVGHSFEDPVWSTVDAATIQRLTAVYRLLVKSGKISRDQSLEAGLRIQYNEQK
jgi:hypothetical protein